MNSALRGCVPVVPKATAKSENQPVVAVVSVLVMTFWLPKLHLVHRFICNL